MATITHEGPLRIHVEGGPTLTVVRQHPRTKLKPFLIVDQSRDHGGQRQILDRQAALEYGRFFDDVLAWITQTL